MKLRLMPPCGLPLQRMRRRVFLGPAAGGVIAGARARSFAATPSLGSHVSLPSLIDTNVTLGHWVVRRSWAESAEAMVAKFRRHGVTAAWTGSVDGVLHSDLGGVNERLADACRREGGGVLLPFGTVNPTLPDCRRGASYLASRAS